MFNPPSPGTLDHTTEGTIMAKLRVKEGMHLHWPEKFRDAYRGGPGTVVDTDAPFEDEFLEGQHYKLEPAPDDAEPTQIQHMEVLGYILYRTREANANQPKPVAAVAQSAREATAKTDDIPDPELPHVEQEERSGRGRHARRRA